MVMSKSRRDWTDKNRAKINATTKIWRDKNKEKLKIVRENRRFGGNKDKALKRDGFKCQECGMTREEHLDIFKKDLDVHHIDGHGRNSKTPNHKLSNLITYCTSCHTKEDRRMMMKRRWGDLVKQDDSEWKYPEIRRLVKEQIKIDNKTQEAKMIVSKNTGMSFTLIDHRYYIKKERRISKLKRGKK